MLFNSIEFLGFFAIVFALYYLPPLQKFQVPILIIASLIFYSWSSPALVLILLLSIFINATASFQVARIADKRQRFFWAAAGVVLNLLILSLFKYAALLTNFVADVFNIARNEGSIAYLFLTLPLPIGISFYTFEGISLIADVLTQKDKNATESNAESTPVGVSPTFTQHLINTSFFISFFPNLLSGPILRSKTFYPQIEPKYLKDIPVNFVFRSLVVGYFLKMVIADNLKDYTFWISFPYYQGFGTLTNLTLLFGYSMQIFADFAGYSLIAIGFAAALGYRIPDNFNFPYISRSLSEFWRRWHISLSTWLRDYLYFPLGGNRKGKIRTYFNLMAVMTLGGLWHGAAWSYAVWGIYHGFGLAVERFLGFDKSKNKSPAPNPAATKPWLQFLLDSFSVLGIFAFVSLGWLLFKLPRFEEAVDFAVTLIRNYQVGPGWSYIIPTLIFSIPVVIYHIPHFPTWQNLVKPDAAAKSGQKVWNIYQDLALGIMLATIFLNSGSSKQFIYFQF
ncbi:MAG: MBOAT family protein [Oscillatoriaceae cyanobacterium Prado104]|jgi:alginate O-acetyltransferase complex protein AlgI|nr:MBOAT family protein [Oscillatoriaceae cyanobacterium Prado104]